jgi:uncharacterized protein YbjT (DUF2867 family)
VTQDDSSAKVDLVFGASGYIGSNLVPFLLEDGRRVRAVSRNREVLEGRGWQGAELAVADALEPASLDPVLAGVDVAYYLVHSMAAGKQFPELDARAAANFAAAAARSGVRRIVYLGGLLPDTPASEHLRSRRETGDILRAGPVAVTEIRAGMIIGPGSAAWEVIRDLVNYLPVMVTPRWVKSRSTPIALSNLLRYLADVGKLAATAGETYEAGGPDTLTYIQVMRQYGDLVGRRPIILQVPVLTPRLSSYWLRLVTSVPTNIGRALIDGLSQDVIAHDKRLQELIPQDLLDFRNSVREALDAERRHDVPARWVEGWIACQDFRPRYSFYAKRASAAADTTVERDELWRAVLAFGEGSDFFFANWQWWLRRALDWLVGGPSFRRSRRHPRELRVGDVIDAWRVIDVQPYSSLTLLMEMRAPGAGVLEFSIDDKSDGRRIEMTAYWHPAGVWGLLYWYALLPFHGYLFSGTAAEIVRRAEAHEA